MADFKYGGRTELRTGEGLFRDFDPQISGGLVLSAAQQNGEVLYDIIEIRDPYWTGGNTELATRTTAATMKYVKARQNGNGMEAVWKGPEFDPNAPTLGWERELSTTHKGKPWRIARGTDVVYPKQPSEPMEELGLDPEAFDVMVEDKAPRPANGYEELVTSIIIGTAERERWLQSHELNTPNLTVYPHALKRSDRNSLKYVGLILDQMDQDSYASDFIVMSHQLTVGMHSPEAAGHAINELQPYNSLYSFLTGAGAICDSSFETTIGEHYNEGVKLPEQAEGEWRTPVLQEDDYLRELSEVAPYDWREILRETGSPSGGSLAEPAPTDLTHILRMGDEKMANTEAPLVSAVRALGLHTDRERLDHGGVELSALGTSGGNLHIELAVKELAAKQVVGLQMEYAAMSQAERDERQKMYGNAAEIGHINNLLMAINGRDARLGDANSNPLSLKEMLEEAILYADKYSPVPVSEKAKRELLAKFSGRDWKSECDTPDDVFNVFFQPNSPMTATEALRYANQLAPHTPVDDLLEMYSNYRRQHVFEVEQQYLENQG